MLDIFLSWQFFLQKNISLSPNCKIKIAYAWTGPNTLIFLLVQHNCNCKQFVWSAVQFLLVATAIRK